MNTMTELNIPELIARHFPNGRTFIPVRKCSICNHPIGYRYMGEKLYFDGNCKCLTSLSPLRPRNWDEVPNLPTPDPTHMDILEDDQFTIDVEEALDKHGLDAEKLDTEALIFDYQHNNVDLGDVHNLLEYSKRRIVLDSITNGQIRQAQEQCERYGLDFHQIRVQNRTMKQKQKG